MPSRAACGCEQRRKWVDARTAAGNQLLQQLKEVYPAALDLLGKSVFATGFLAILERFPSQKELRRASPRQLLSVLPKLRRVVDDGATADPRVTAIRAVGDLVDDEPLLTAGRLSVVHWTALLGQFNRTIADYDRQIEVWMAKRPEAEFFRDLPGAGESLAPRLAAAWGCDRERFQSADQVAQWTGIAPITKQSGQMRIVSKRVACPKFLRQTFHEFARCSIFYSAWAGAYYRMLRARGQRHHSAIRSLAFKWIRVLFRCWKDVCVPPTPVLPGLTKRPA